MGYTPLKAIRKKCLDCCAGQSKEVRLCTATECPLYAFRMGNNPNRTGIAPSHGLCVKKQATE